MSSLTDALGAARTGNPVLSESPSGLFGPIFDALPAAVYVCDSDGVVVLYNKAAAALWGRAPNPGNPDERFCGSHRMYLIDGSALPHAECPMVEVLRTGIPAMNLEVVLERPDGSRVIALANIQPLKDDAGNITGAVNCLHDITDRKHFEQQMRDSEQRHLLVRKTVLESERRLAAELGDAKLLQSISTELIHEGDVEALYESIIDAAVIIMRSDYASMQMLYPERGSGGELRLLAFRGFNPEAAKFWEWVRADSESTCGVSLRTGKRTVTADVRTCEFMAGSEDLATYLQTGIHAVQTTPLISRSGRLLGMISTHWREPHDPSESDLQRLDVLARQAADLIERAQAEAALRESEERYRSLVSVITDVPWTTNADGAFVEFQPTWSKFTGQSWEQMRGFGWSEMLHPDDRERVRNIWKRAVASRTLYESAGRIWHHASQEYRRFVARGTPVFAANGDVREWVGTCTDVSDYYRAEEHQKLLLREMNHRIKNLFAVAGSIVTLTARSAKTADDLCNIVQARLGAFARAHELIRPEVNDAGEAVGSVTTLKAVVDTILAPHIDHSSDRACLVANGREVTIGPNAATHIALLLHELATNAVKYGSLSDPGGSIEIGWSLQADSVLIEWTERGGPLIATPEQDGFGTRLLQASVRQLGGRITHQWQPEGLAVRLTLSAGKLSH